MGAQSLPVIVGMGGVNGAGRSSAQQAYRRMVYGALGTKERTETLAALARMMDRANADVDEQRILRHTLIRKLEDTAFDPETVRWNQRVEIQTESDGIRFTLARRDCPSVLPPTWEVVAETVTHLEVKAQGLQRFLMPSIRSFEVKCASQLPSGFDPGALYPSRNHPKGLQMSVFAASDALGDLGIDWQAVQSRVAADQISVYAGSAMGQLDEAGGGGMMSARAYGKRVTSKYCPLSLAEMPADFINAYVLGAMGSTGAGVGACASFLYNLRMAVQDIRAGRARVAVVGGAEAPINPQVMEGYAAMGALATARELCELDGLAEGQEPDHHRACRPFAENCGFTMAESAQVLVLFDEALALELGATVYGAATHVFVNADGFKKSISGPGVGNYITFAKATEAARAMLGDDALRSGGIVQAHGTGTPQNRITESAILSRVAGAFGITDWPVAAIKSYIGHSLGAAAGDQIAATIGAWQHGWLPGITTVDAIADDVEQAGLAFALTHQELDLSAQRYAIVNSKGFGGNNATATLLSPEATMQLLVARHGAKAMDAWRGHNESVRESARAYDAAMSAGKAAPVYHFDHGVLGDGDVVFRDKELVIGGERIALDEENPFADN
ncbi:MAG: beta-ketoacyl synthase [Gammaproteobacteria bacterium]|nr:MAG: beta-ketoacyl synthase [Gammaproteobacteria bacterium]